MKHVLGLSGGKDSTCLALAMKERHPDIDMEYICTPTGNELPDLFAHLDKMEELLSKPILRLGIGKTLEELIDHMAMLPNFRSRWCTRILKIEPTIRYMKALPAGSKLYVGLRADEPHRDGIYGGDVESVFPFKEWGWGIEEVYGFLEERGICVPARSDCSFCYHQRIVEWRNLWRDYPDLYAQAEAIEERHGHTFRSPGRDTWPVKLVELKGDFASGRKIRGEAKFEEEKDRCRVCSL